VARAAAERMTPYVLELGGKNPVLVDTSLDSVEVAARRIAWGRTLNAGQVCVAPDYVVCLEGIADRFEAALVAAFAEMYGPDPARSADLGRLITPAAVRRIQGLVKDAESAGKIRIVSGGQMDAEARYVAPTVVRVADSSPAAAADCPFMQEETFGPVIAVVRVKNLDHAVEYVERVSGRHPLGLYVFSNRRAFQEECLSRIRSGGAAINDVVVQSAAPNLPFGGLGSSGLGCYGGRYSFETFSHGRAVVHKHLNGALFDPPLRYAPFTPFKCRAFRLALDYLPDVPAVGPVVAWVLRLLPVAALALLARRLLPAA